jgi:hypothetical protein
MPADLKEGQWRWIDPHEMALLAQPIELAIAAKTMS